MAQKNTYTILLMLLIMAGNGWTAEDIDAPPIRQKMDASYDVVVKARNSVVGRRVCLKDIATIHAAEPLKERIESLKITSSPRLGETRYIPPARVSSVIRSKKWIPKTLDISLPETIFVERTCQTIDEERIQDLFYDYVDSQIPGNDFMISDFKIRGLKKLPLGEIGLAFQGEGERVDPNGGWVRLRLNVRVDGKRKGTLMLSGFVDRFVDVVCAARALERNTVITRQDIMVMQKNVAKESASFIRGEEDVIGKKMKRHVQKGELIVKEIIEEPSIIHRNDQLIMLARKGSLKITTKGVAKEDGILGAQINVENLSSGKTVLGRVIDAKTVEVFF